MTTVPEPGETKCPKCGAGMVQVETARQEGQTTMRFECPACEHTLTDPVGASSSPSGW
jgi:ssDNA-binding Zn-finger/Zn-ribbon topoisomerase 1